MKSGDILLCKGGRDIVSRLISWGTKSKYTHVSICVSDRMNLAIEAISAGGVRAIDTRNIKREYDVYRIKEGNTYDLNKVVSFLVSNLNKKYDFKGVAYLGWLKVLGKFGFKTKGKANRWQKDRDYFCSELVYESFMHGGLDIVPQVKEADITSPADIEISEIVEMITS